MAQCTARICWILHFGVFACSLFALNCYPLSFAVCRGKEMLLSVPGSMLGVLKYVEGCLVRHCTLQTLQMGIWKVSYCLICAWNASLRCPCSHEFPMFSLIPVGLLQVVRTQWFCKRMTVNIWTGAAAPDFLPATLAQAVSHFSKGHWQSGSR